MENINEKEITLKDVINSISETRTALEKKIDSVEDNLAAVSQKQFLANQEYMDKKFGTMDAKIDDLDATVKTKLVEKFTHKGLEFRVEKLEEKSKKYDGLLQPAV